MRIAPRCTPVAGAKSPRTYAETSKKEQKRCKANLHLLLHGKLAGASGPCMIVSSAVHILRVTQRVLAEFWASQTRANKNKLLSVVVHV